MSDVYDCWCIDCVRRELTIDYDYYRNAGGREPWPTWLRNPIDCDQMLAESYITQLEGMIS